MTKIQEVRITWKKQVLPVVVIGAPTPDEIRETPSDTLIVIGSGNPGFCHLYQDFALSIHRTTGLPVWIMGLVGFVGEDVISDDELDNHNLEMQVEMKKHVIAEYLHSVNLICVDHSTSCYIFVQLMQDKEISKRIIDAFLLMPVLTLPDGVMWKFCNLVLQSRIFSAAVQVIASINDQIPQEARKKLFGAAYQLLWFSETPDLASHMNSKVITYYFHLGKLLFKKQMDMGFLRELSHRFQIICSNSDILLHSKIREIAEHSANGSIVETAHCFFADNASQFGVDVGQRIMRNQTASAIPGINSKLKKSGVEAVISTLPCSEPTKASALH